MRSKGEKSGRRSGALWITLGLLLIAAALFLASYNLYDGLRAGQHAAETVEVLEGDLVSKAEPEEPEQQTPEEQELPGYLLSPYMEMPVKSVDGVDYIGVVRIPALGLELPVISQWSYDDLRIAPCRYSGSAYLGNLVICGHNYSAHFGKLKSLQQGDTVSFTDMDGNEFSYTVEELEVLRPTAVEEMKSGDWELTLFTCTLDGKSRVAVRCVQN